MSEKRIHLPLMGEKTDPQNISNVELPSDAPLKDRVIAAIKTIFDPELPVNIYDLGLIYELNVADSGDVFVRMTLTTPNCPVAGSFPQQVREKIVSVPGVRSATVELVWEPPWTKDRLSEAAQLELGLF